MREEMRELRGEMTSQAAMMQLELRALSATLESLVHVTSSGGAPPLSDAAPVSRAASTTRQDAGQGAGQGAVHASKSGPTTGLEADGGRCSARLDWPSCREDSAGGASPTAGAPSAGVSPAGHAQRWV